MLCRQLRVPAPYMYGILIIRNTGCVAATVRHSDRALPCTALAHCARAGGSPTATELQGRVNETEVNISITMLVANSRVLTLPVYSTRQIHGL